FSRDWSSDVCSSDLADARMLQTRTDDHDDDGEEQQQVIVFLRTRNSEAEDLLAAPEDEVSHLEGIDAVDTLGAVRNIDGGIQVVHEDADDLAEAQGDDGEVIASQLKRRRSEEHT